MQNVGFSGLYITHKVPARYALDSWADVLASLWQSTAYRRFFKQLSPAYFLLFVKPRRLMLSHSPIDLRQKLWLQFT